VRVEDQAIALRRARYWRRVLRITGALLGGWLLVTLVGPWFARDLAALQVGGFPLSFWVASQGALLLYVAIIVIYAHVMDRLDAQFLREEAAADHD
jgi:putative solute:sodium symporter small subunit